jgi:phosphoribosylpyrophosphate synthetase
MTTIELKGFVTLELSIDDTVGSRYGATIAGRFMASLLNPAGTSCVFSVVTEDLFAEKIEGFLSAIVLDITEPSCTGPELCNEYLSTAGFGSTDE